MEPGTASAAWPQATGSVDPAGNWIVYDSGPGRSSSAARYCAGARLVGMAEQRERDERRAHRCERGTDGPEVIVIGVDGSDSSMRAAAYAAGLARRQGALLTVVYVQPSLTAGRFCARRWPRRPTRSPSTSYSRSGRQPNG